ncbi:hypothetical protein [Actinomadura alba]|uniref:LPXTG-motif cell wall anchor domain-containing protein n=1 Tax=Actinomadura alba TaxID=406431 RepID=A0ABR7LK69_9ACTN|nr:hypothetical protein [Actinomadura alba]MBC6465242.1 hypothetical protein [Actinomadura alba]
MPRRTRLGPGTAIGILILYGLVGHHGGSGSYEARRPLYLRGRLIQARYGFPHARLRIEVPADLEVPDPLPDVQRLRGHRDWDGPPVVEGAGKVRELLLPPDLTGEVGAMNDLPQVGDDVSAIAYRRCAADGDEYAGELRVQMLYVNGRSLHYRGSITRIVDACPPDESAPPQAVDTRGPSEDPPLVLLGGGAAVAAGFIIALLRLRNRRTRSR